MAESDTRLETLEDEVKVLKGEVKRTLVDLRALLMREDSPLADAGFSRRAPAPEPPAPKKEVAEVVTEVVAPTPVVQPEPAPVEATPPTPVTASPGPSAPPEAPPIPVMASPGPGVPPGAPPAPLTPVPGPGPAPDSFAFPVATQAVAPPPQAYPDPGPGPGPLPASPAFQDPPGPGPDLAGLAEQERRLADQERRIAEQEIRMAQREQDMEESSRGEGQPQSPEWVEETEDAEVENPSPAKSLSKKAKDLKPGPGPKLEIVKTAPVNAVAVIEEEELETASPDLMPDLLGVGAPQVAPSSPSPRHSETEPGKRIGERRAKVARKQEGLEMELGELDKIATHPTDTPSPETRGVNVYDEYWELLKETRDMPASGELPSGPPLDVNLLSSLVHWTSVAKQRVGEQQLRDILELYIQSRHSRPELQELLLHISTIVEEVPKEPVDNREQCMDLMFHLHGILTGGLPVIQIPQMQFASRNGSEVDGES